MKGMIIAGSIGYCDLHDGEVEQREFGWKGCWNCHHFEYSADSPYVDVQEAAKLLDRSVSTVRKWLKAGRLKGQLFVRGRSRFQLGSPRKWLVCME